MGSNSVSTNEREEAVFKAEEFRKMKKGQFIGFTADCNHEVFRGKILPPEATPRSIEDVVNVSEADLLSNFKSIIDRTKSDFIKND